MTTDGSRAIDLDPDTYQLVQLLARAWNVAPSDVVRRLIAQLGQEPARRTHVSSLAPSPIAVHAIYAGVRIDASYDPTTTSVAILHGPGKGTYRTPSGATTAVLQALRPTVVPNRTGWTFWRINATGELLSKLRPTWRPNPSHTTSPVSTRPSLPSNPRR